MTAVLDHAGTRPDARRAARRKAAEPWQEMAYAQYLAAESACNGVLLSKRGIAAGIDPWPALWTGPEHVADAWMSWELAAFFERSPRITITQFQRMQRDQERSYLDELDRDDPGAVRPDPGDRPQGEGVHRDGRLDDVPRPAARGPAQAVRERASAHAGRGGHVRPGGPVMTPRERVSALAESARNGTHWAAQGGAEDVTETPALPAAYRGQVEVRQAGAVVPVRQEIDGDQVLRYLYTFLSRFAVWGSEAEIVTAALWIAHTHARDGDGVPVWQYLARLGVLGPKGSGKSWKCRLIGKLCWSAEILVVPTKAAFIDLCAENNTIIVTEADEQFRTSGKSREIVAIANAAYEPDRTAPRKQGGMVVKVPLFAHLVLDGIDEVLLSPSRPDLGALMSRCIIIPARKAPEGYRPPRFDRQGRGIAEQIGKRASAWMAQEVASGMADDVPRVPEHLGNRPFALWEPLFTVALRADKGDPDGPWSQACAAACEQLEDGPGLPQETGDEETELDRQMAAWDEEGSR